MKKIAFVLLIGLIILGCSETKKLTYLQHRPVACIYLDGFTTVNDVKKVGEGLRMGIIIVKENISGDIFSAMVIPYKEIPKGTRVKLINIQYSQGKGGGNDYFFLVEEEK